MRWLLFFVYGILAGCVSYVMLGAMDGMAVLGTLTLAIAWVALATLAEFGADVWGHPDYHVFMWLLSLLASLPLLRIQHWPWWAVVIQLGVWNGPLLAVMHKSSFLQ